MIEFAQLMPHLTPYLADVGSWSVDAWHAMNSLSMGHGSDWVMGQVNQFNQSMHGFNLHWAVLAQQFDTDVFAATRRSVGEFVESGKLWVLLIGIVIGYILKSLTSYG